MPIPKYRSFASITDKMMPFRLRINSPINVTSESGDEAVTFQTGVVVFCITLLKERMVAPYSPSKRLLVRMCV